ALDPRNLVDRIHGICLTGGSAYGLAAADGVMAELEHRMLGVPVGPDPDHAVPVVPAAVIFDLGRGGVFRNRPDASFGRRAAASAGHRSIRGSIGAGTGARACGLQGGVGMSSTTIELGGMIATVAALAIVNASGSVVDPRTGRPWSYVRGLVAPLTAERRLLDELRRSTTAPPLNTTIGIVATDVALTRPEAGRLAQSGHDGLARAIRPAHSLMDGDTLFGLSTGAHHLPDTAASLVRNTASRASALNRLFAAAADVVETACVDALLTATTIGSAPSYRSVCPSVFRRLDDR
ncbi:MAG: P1 family peptidase, partial [Ilumatobacteraceae bacterium]